ncbi:beta-ketoacyl synthase N-terminal-like domain-containing protein [Ahniella affigens]|nr:beta-ketoacyl synthase N-terminal-like domain-containing protein [Ahniella affigens]
MSPKPAVFAPIAIVGHACVLPGALSPDALWAAVVAKADLTCDVPVADWRMPNDSVLLTPGMQDADRCQHSRAGRVQGFADVWNPEGFAVPAATLQRQDPMLHWLLHSAREALRNVPGTRQRVGAVLGNLGFPTASMARFAENVWTDAAQSEPSHRYMSGGTAAWFARALQLDQGAFCLDAACASSLYALKLACDRLHDGRADLMLAGAVQGADDLFLHVGFSALKALSPSGQSRPFHRDADGLIPAEGAAVFALKRLADAVRDGDTIHGVIRGIGLCNDGKGRGLLVPDQSGQERCLRLAYASADLNPSDVSLLECHATGTSVGDATELRSAAAVFGDHAGLPIGSLKSNLGHLITAAGGAGLIKVLMAMRHQMRPPTRFDGALNPALPGLPFRVLTETEAWPSDGPRIAAVSAFGFGGNNAHLIVSEFAPELLQAPVTTTPTPARFALVGVGLLDGEYPDWASFASAAPATNGENGASSPGAMPPFDLELSGLRLPPNDLNRCLPQQLALFNVLRQAWHGQSEALPSRTAVIIGMEPDPNVARYGLRWRLANQFSGAALTEARDAVVPALDAAAVLGTMPNIPANRLSSQFDLMGPSFTVQALADSGLQALSLALDALTHHDVDLALVGVSEFAADDVDAAASGRPGSDGAIMLAIKRWDDASREHDRIIAEMVLDPNTNAPRALDPSPEQVPSLGAAAGLHALLAPLRAANRNLSVAGEPALGDSAHRSRVLPDGRTLRLLSPSERRRIDTPVPGLHLYSGANRQHVLAALRARQTSDVGPARLVILADASDYEAQHQRAEAMLEQGLPNTATLIYREQPIAGDVAFVFTGAGASYADMGRALLADLPELTNALRRESPRLLEGLRRAWEPDFEQADPSTQLLAASALSQCHLRLSEDILGLRADAWLGYSSGETNALFASGIWHQPDALMADMDASGLMQTTLAGEFRTLQTLWPESLGFATWTVLAPLAEVQERLQAFPRVRLCIVDSAEQCLIAGDREQCEHLVQAIGRTRCLPLSYSMIVHMPEVRAEAEAWYRLHARTAHPIRHGRIYSSAWAKAYEPSESACAQAILDQAIDTLDIRRVIEQAWQDGVRLFVEHGPGSSFSRAIRAQLGERDAVIVSLDRKGQGLSGLWQVVAQLRSAGFAVDLAAITRRLGIYDQVPAPTRPYRVQPHWPNVRRPTNRQPLALEAAPKLSDPFMKPAPALPPSSLPPVVWRSTRPNAAAVDVDTPVVPAVRAPVATAMRVAAVPAAITQVAPASSATTPAAAIAPTPPTVTVATAHAGVVAPTPIAPPETASALPAAALQHQLQQLTSLQQQYLAHQLAAHQRFLAIREQAVRVLLASGAQAQDFQGQVAHTAFDPPTPGVAPTPIVAQTAPRSEPSVNVSTVPEAPPAPVLRPEPRPAPASIAVQTATIPALAPPTGPTFSREQLEVHADGAISRIFGPAFTGQDHYLRQVRMPKPPLLLADRVVGLDAEPMALGKGRIWTETDVGSQTWYLHHEHMPAGVMIEAGQADLMLISWAGIDSVNRGERVYRLLGCELTYHGDLPKRGDTLRFQIDLDGHAAQGDVRLMFFHYDCYNGARPQLSVRQGQAGFFTDQELADSAGCLWRAEDQDIRADARVDAPLVTAIPERYERAALDAFAAGDLVRCFGPDFGFTRTHTRTPTFAAGDLLLFDRVTSLSSHGGPWQRGYLRAELDIHPDQWFFDGHFKNDPCMPGTLMFDACLGAMAFYLAAMGYTLKRDGWRFQPVPEVPYKLQCRGQVTPRSRQLVTEIFVEERHDGPIPTLYADLLCTVDGLKAFHARRVGLQLVPAWPMAYEASIPPIEATRPVATVDGFRFDQRALLACADGRPSEAFGPMYRRFDGVQRVARLPSPPYHFISRIAEIDGPIGVMKAGARVLAEYDVPAEAWYFSDNHGVMPFSVLLEAALQPCGWLSSYVGSALTQEIELGFRNLDGDGTIFAEIHPGSGTLKTEVCLTDVSASGGMIIESFEVHCWLGAQDIYRLKTVFGFFPEAALANQAGLPANPMHQQLRVEATPAAIEVASADAASRLKLAKHMLQMIDRIEGYWPTGGKAGLGAARAVKDIDPGEWFFKAHFFQDPVQPGSLGLEAMVQTLAYVMLEQGMADGIESPRFETIATGFPHRWKYRGQVLPKHRIVQTTLEVIERGRDQRGPFAIAEASLWVDGQRIYEASGLGLRIVSAASTGNPC